MDGVRRKIVFEETVAYERCFLHFYTVNLVSFILRVDTKYPNMNTILALFHSTHDKDITSATWEHISQDSDICGFPWLVPESMCSFITHWMLYSCHNASFGKPCLYCSPASRDGRGRKPPHHEMIRALIPRFCHGLCIWPSTSHSAPLSSHFYNGDCRMPVCLIFINHNLLMEDTCSQCMAAQIQWDVDQNRSSQEPLYYK